MNSENKRLKIAFLTALDPKDRSCCSWTATMYYMGQALEKHCGEVDYLGPIKTNERRVGNLIHKVSRLLFKKNFLYERSFFLARKHAQVAAERLVQVPFDVIVAPIGTTETAFLHTNIPIVLVKDATFALLHNYYDKFSNLWERSVREASLLEELGNRRASLLTFTSAWAANSAIQDHGADPCKVHVVPFGANFDSPPPIEVIEKRKQSDCCRLLFVGADWQRKGGDIAFETLLKLEEMGVQAELIVCGCTPLEKISHERMRVIPFLNKNNEKQRKELETLFETSDFLILPTRSDCVPTVLCEAAAYGLPVVTTNTGGIPDVVGDGENGFTLPLSARGAEYAEVIAQVYRDEQRYAELVRSSRAVFDNRLCWDAWGMAHKQLIFEMLESEENRENVAVPGVTLSYV